MSDLIKRQAAIDLIETITVHDGAMIDHDTVLWALMVLPSAQLEIIRCKECRHYVEQHRLCKGMDQYTCHMKPDDFCSKAERRES